jgi:hypothetical protein
MPDWERHENHVAALYRSLGFDVTHNLNVEGQQVDLVCEKLVAGIGRTRLCIDCKHTRLDENRSVSKDDVDQFIFTFHNRAASSGWTAGVMISNRPFSQYAKAAAAKHQNIHLKTISELHEEILHVHPYLHSSVRRYEEMQRFHDFILPQGSKGDSDEETAEAGPLVGIVDKWLLEHRSPQLCLFGDFGTGKTTFLEYLHYTLAKEYLAGAAVRIPLFIPLRRYYEATDHEDIASQFFSLECGTELQYPLFHEFLTQGRLLLLLDGFDEMGARSDPMVRKANYLKLAGFVEGASKVIISCRPAYFLSIYETHSVFSFMTKQIGFVPTLKQGRMSEQLYKAVEESDLAAEMSQAKSALSSTTYTYLSLFGAKEIRAYLRKHDDTIKRTSGGQLDAKGLFARIKDIYDLQDLAKRPILLKLIVGTLPLFQSTDGGGYRITLGGEELEIPEVTPSILYTVYTEKELEREYKRGKVRWLIDRKDKSRVIASIAFEMFKHDTLAIDKGALSQIIQKAFPESATDQAHYLTDIRTCSFLTRDSQDSVRFTHKSFMEFYAAVSIRMRLSTREAAQDLLSSRPLNDEVSFFVGDGIASSPDVEHTIALLRGLLQELSKVPAPSEACVQNILNILNYSRRPIPLIRNGQIENLVYRKLSLSEQEWEDVTITTLRTVKLQVQKLTILRATVRNWEMESAQIKTMSGNSTEIRGLRAWDSHVDRLVMSKCSVSIETWRESRLKDVDVEDTVITTANDSVSTEWLPEGGVFKNCILVGVNACSDDVRYIGCTFIMCRAQRAPNRDPRVEQCRGVVVDPRATTLRYWGAGIMACASTFGEEARSALPRKSLTWEELLVLLFGTELKRLPQNPKEIKTRLSQADVALELSRHWGERVLIEGDLTSEQECELVRSDAHTVTMLKLRTKAEFTKSLRKAEIKTDKTVTIKFAEIS